MKSHTAQSSLVVTFLLTTLIGTAQLRVTETNSALQLAQNLVGEGVIISNVSITQTGLIRPAGIFKSLRSVNIGIDSGIVLTTGRAKTDFSTSQYGVDGNGTFPASAKRADNVLGTPGDATLANELGVPITDLNDAVALEFDFVPLGDSIKFNYVMSSEEYTTETVCIYNDAFGFFISGPGITGSKNIALIPGTNTPVTITNINNITTANCVNNPQYYIDKTTNVFFIHEGHTKVFAAVAGVIPCETYHLKLVVADVGDRFWDTGVFIQARSLSSNAIKITNFTPLDSSGNNHLAEGCVPGTFVVSRPKKDAVPLNVSLAYAGSAQNGTDVLTLPSSVTIPANDSFVVVNVSALADGAAEGVEVLNVYALGSCGSATPTDSTSIQIRDYGLLNLSPDTVATCRDASVQLNAPPGYSTYKWNNAATLNNPDIPNPVATPLQSFTAYTCTAAAGSCLLQDSVVIEWKDITVKIFAGNDTVAAINQPLQLLARETTNIGVTNYSWSPRNFLDNPDIASPIATLAQDYHYVVTGKTPGGCTTTDDIFIKVYKGPDIYVPSGFTPNNDGLNDVLKAIPVGIRELRYFRIFNRWGQMVFSTRNPQQGWDGKIKGAEQPTGSFVWVAEAIDYLGNQVVYKGIVTIIR